MKIELHFFNRWLDDPDWFIGYHADKLEEHVNMFGRIKTWEAMGLSQQAGAEMIAERQTIVTALRRLIAADPDTGENMPIWTEDDENSLARVREITESI